MFWVIVSPLKFPPARQIPEYWAHGDAKKEALLCSWEPRDLKVKGGCWRRKLRYGLGNMEDVSCLFTLSYPLSVKLEPVAKKEELEGHGEGSDEFEKGTPFVATLELTSVLPEVSEFVRLPNDALLKVSEVTGDSEAIDRADWRLVWAPKLDSVFGVELDAVGVGDGSAGVGVGSAG